MTQAAHMGARESHTHTRTHGVGSIMHGISGVPVLAACGKSLAVGGGPESAARRQKDEHDQETSVSSAASLATDDEMHERSESTVIAGRSAAISVDQPYILDDESDATMEAAEDGAGAMSVGHVAGNTSSNGKVEQESCVRNGAVVAPELRVTQGGFASQDVTLGAGPPDSVSGDRSGMSLKQRSALTSVKVKERKKLGERQRTIRKSELFGRLRKHVIGATETDASSFVILERTICHISYLRQFFQEPPLWWYHQRHLHRHY